MLSLLFLLLFVWDSELVRSDDGSKVALFSMAGELPGELLMSDALLFLLLTAALYHTDSDSHVVLQARAQEKQRSALRAKRVGDDWSCRVVSCLGHH